MIEEAGWANMPIRHLLEGSVMMLSHVGFRDGVEEASVRCTRSSLIVELGPRNGRR